MSQPLKISGPVKLRDFNPGYHAGLDKDKTREKSERLCEKLAALQQLLYANHSHSIIVLLQGMDTSGKDGAGKKLLEFVSPSGVETTNFKTPSSEELAHDFLWRVHKAVPRFGNIGIFNRSHYEDVLIVRVMNLEPKTVWSARYEQINAFEKLLAQNNVILLKFFLHISKAEQARRLEARLNDPAKNWKFEMGDLTTRKHWNAYEKAYEDLLNFCSPTHSPWHIVPANHKWYRDYVIAQTVVSALEKLKMKWPKPIKHPTHVKIS